VVLVLVVLVLVLVLLLLLPLTLLILPLLLLLLPLTLLLLPLTRAWRLTKAPSSAAMRSVRLSLSPRYIQGSLLLLFP